MITADRLEKVPKRLVVTFAADCAERVLPIFERAYPEDPRPREAIATVREWIEGGASEEQLQTAARSAGKASGKPLGDHAVTGAPGWMTGLLANDAEARRWPRHVPPPLLLCRTTPSTVPDWRPTPLVTR